ncbi:MAG: hypothetical protein R6V10_05730 [bacterium]
MDRRKFISAAAAGGAGLGLSRLSAAGNYDLVLQDVKCLVNGSFERADVAIKADRIAAILPPRYLKDAPRIITGDDLYVSPGWVDLHVHYVDWKHRKSPGASISRLGLAQGVTALQDAGTVGAENFDRLLDAVADKDSEIPCYSLLSIKKEGIKLTDFYTTRKGYDDIPAMETVIEKNRGRISGLKVRADSQVSPKDDRLYYVQKIREAGDRFGLPSMIHISTPPPSLRDILPYMKEGDMVTHFLRGQGNSIIGENGKVLDEVKEARRRGVRFDAGHGMGSFSFSDAERALDQGFDDFTISSDLYILSIPLYAKTFANVLTQFLAAGMPLEHIMERAGTRPASVLGLEREIKQGAEATLSVFSVKTGEWKCKDVTGNTRRSDRRIIPEWTILNGVPCRAGEHDKKVFL